MAKKIIRKKDNAIREEKLSKTLPTPKDKDEPKSGDKKK
jgi:hypothetical protein